MAGEALFVLYLPLTQLIHVFVSCCSTSFHLPFSHSVQDGLLVPFCHHPRGLYEKENDMCVE